MNSTQKSTLNQASKQMKFELPQNSLLFGNEYKQICEIVEGLKKGEGKEILES